MFCYFCDNSLAFFSIFLGKTSKKKYICESCYKELIEND